MRIGTTGALLVVLGVLALGLPPLALWVGEQGEDRLGDAREAQRELITGALGAINAETGVRGYILTANEDFRSPYDIGVRQVEASAARMEELIEDPGALAELREVEADFGAWRREFADVQIDRVEAGALEQARSLESLEPGRELFDEVRQSFEIFLARISADAAAAEDDRDRADRIQMGLVLLGMVALLGFVGTLGYLFTSRRRGEEALRTARRDLARERELSRSRKEVLATASHELRNPLTGLLLSAQILEEEAVATENEELAMMSGELVVSARRAADMVKDLLDFTRLEAGGDQLQREQLAPELIVASAVRDVQLSHGDAEIVVETDNEEGVKVRGDFPRLRMVLRNLLENAYRYGTPPVRVRISNGGPRVEIHVEDSGPGVPAGERDEVFEQYRRGTTATGRDGTGIGLYISKGIVELHGGSISVERSPLGGADFVVALPPA